MELYINEKYPYGSKCDAICCYYEYGDIITMQGVVNWQQRLIIVKEIHFGKVEKDEIVKLISGEHPWINKNDYFAKALGYLKSYYLDFNDESDIKMLTDEFTELIDNNRVVYEAQKTNSKNRDKCLQLVVKALHESLVSGVSSFMERKEPFLNPYDIHYRDYVPPKQNSPIFENGLWRY